MIRNLPFSNGSIVLNSDENGVSVTRLNDSLTVHTSFTPWELGACAMALMTDEYRQEGRLRDASCRVVRQDESTGKAICELNPVSPRLRSKEPEQDSGQFSEKTAPLRAMLNIRVLDRGDSDVAAIRAGFTELDLICLTRLSAAQRDNETILVGMAVTVSRDEEGILLRCGGSEWRRLTEAERGRLVSRLRKWLSGDRSRHVTFNADNLHFNRRPRLIINGVSSHPLSYVEVAQLYLVLETVTSETSQPSEPGNA